MPTNRKFFGIVIQRFWRGTSRHFKPGTKRYPDPMRPWGRTADMRILHMTFPHMTFPNMASARKASRMKHAFNFLRHGFRLGLVLLFSFQSAQAAELNLAVADSTCDAMKKAGALYSGKNPVEFNFICKSSGLLAKGMRGGALNADIFVSADREWMDFAIEHGLVASELVVSPWGNALVVATAKGNSLRMATWQDLASDKVATILIGDPGTAPFGRYAKQALESSGLWERVKHKIETRKNISLLAESLAGANAATVGILFKTHLTGQLRTVYAVDKAWHPPIRYYMAPLKASAGQPEVARFFKFMQGQGAKAVFLDEGFELSDD